MMVWLRLWFLVLVVPGVVMAQAGGSPAAVSNEVRTRLESGDLTGAERLSAEARGKWPKTADFPHLQGLADFRLGRLDAAAKALTEAQKLAPSDPDIAFDLGLVRMAQQRYEEAATQFESAAKDPERARAGLTHVLLGRAYQNSNRSELAVTQFQRALAVEPAVPLGHFHLGFAYESLGKNSQAAAEYEKELSRTRDNPEVFYQYGNVLSGMGDWNKALENLERALRLKPDHADAQYELGKCLLGLGRTAEAVTALQRAVVLAPDSPNAEYQLARALQRAGDEAGAKQHLRRFAELKRLQPDSGGMATGRIK